MPRTKVIEKTNLNPAEVGDIIVGYVLGSGSQTARECKMAVFYAGFPVVDVAASIKPGSSNGGYIRKCFTSLWRDEEGTRPGCGTNVVAGLLTG
nr:3-ketoacyl-CoA thiolase 2, peroxisomal [Tanacetum cinerariifolium]